MLRLARTAGDSLEPIRKAASCDGSIMYQYRQLFCTALARSRHRILPAGQRAPFLRTKGAGSTLTYR